MTIRNKISGHCLGYCKTQLPVSIRWVVLYSFVVSMVTSPFISTVWCSRPAKLFPVKFFPEHFPPKLSPKKFPRKLSANFFHPKPIFHLSTHSLNIWVSGLLYTLVIYLGWISFWILVEYLVASCPGRMLIKIIIALRMRQQQTKISGKAQLCRGGKQKASLLQ